MRNKILWIAVSALLVSGLLIGISCSPTPTSTPSPTTSPAASPTAKPTPTATPTPTTPPKEFNWKLATFAPATDGRTKYFQSIVDEIGKRTNGQLKITIYPAGQLVPEAKSVTAVMDGSVEIAHINAGTFVGTVDLMADAILMPYTWTMDNFLNTIYAQGGLRDILTKVMGSKNMMPYLFQSAGSSDWFFKKPVRTVADWQGLKVRAAGGYFDQVPGLMGATAVRLSSSEVYTGAQQGIIDGATQALSSYVGFKVYEVLPNVTWVKTFLNPAWGVGAMNLKAFNELPPNVQKVLLDIEPEFLPAQVKAMEQVDLGLRKQLEANPKVSIYDLPAEEEAKWFQLMAPLRDQFVKKHGQDGQTILQLWAKGK